MPVLNHWQWCIQAADWHVTFVWVCMRQQDCIGPIILIDDYPITLPSLSSFVDGCMKADSWYPPTTDHDGSCSNTSLGGRYSSGPCKGLIGQLQNPCQSSWFLISNYWMYSMMRRVETCIASEGPHKEHLRWFGMGCWKTHDYYVSLNKYYMWVFQYVFYLISTRLEVWGFVIEWERICVNIRIFQIE